MIKEHTGTMWPLPPWVALWGNLLFEMRSTQYSSIHFKTVDKKISFEINLALTHKDLPT